MTVNDNLAKLNINIQEAPSPVGSYVAYKIVSNILYISGQISIDSKGIIKKGKLGGDLKLEDGQEAAKLCAINIISQAKKACNGDLEKILNCIKITGYVNSVDSFIDQT